MQDERRVPLEALATVSTFMRFLSRAVPPAFIKGWTQGKKVPKVLAFTRFLPSCRDLLLAKKGKAAERPDAVRVSTGLLSGLSSSEPSHFHGVAEVFPEAVPVTRSLGCVAFLTIV